METTKQKLTPAETEALALYLFTFSRAYYACTRKKLETVDQIIDVIEAGEFTFENVFFEHIEECLWCNSDNEDEAIFWEDNMEMFDYQNYFPEKKRVDDGAWIKIRTEKGFEIHWANTAVRKRRFQEEIETAYKKSISLVKRELSGLNDISKKVEEIETHALKAKKLKYERLISELRVRDAIELKPYEVRIKRTKSTTEYFYPYQYELVDDIEQFATAYAENVTGVSTKKLYRSNNEDAIFYMTSRGISRKTAEMMAALKESYFVVNMEEAMTEYNRQWNASVKIVEV